jgi:RNA polymerase sigma-70 factor (ECF subfamily)
MKGNLFAPLAALFGLTDEQAMWRVQMEDDAQAFALLVRRWESPIQRLCARMTGSQDRSEDLAQETFARLYGQRKNYQAEGKFPAFLRRIAVNLCYDDLRRRQRRRETSLEDLGAENIGSIEATAPRAPSPVEATEERERARQVREALLGLPEAYRSVVVLRHYEGLKFREIAEALEIPEGTVKSRMAEGLNQLHRLLSPVLNPGGSRPGKQRETILL